MSESEVSYIPFLREGDEEAARKLWDDYFSVLVRFARKRLMGVPRGDFDEEDVASCALHTFCQGMREGKYDDNKYNDLSNRKKLRNLLFTITARKVSERKRHCSAQKRGAGRILNELTLKGLPEYEKEGLTGFRGTEPTPEQVLICAEDRERIREQLKRLPQLPLCIGFLRDFHSVEEIADKLECSTQTVYNLLKSVKGILGKENNGNDHISESVFRDNGFLPLCFF